MVASDFRSPSSSKIAITVGFLIWFSANWPPDQTEHPSNFGTL
jgi:hypothetical protein